MADIEVTLGARNEASQVLKDFQSQVGQTAQQIEFSFRGLAQLAGATAAVVALVEAGRAIYSLATNSVQAFDDVNRSALKLSETLDLIPNAAANAGDELRKTANELERVTNVDASRIMEQMSQALRRGADPAQLEDMSEAALGLARVFDRDLSSAMRMVEAATNGNFDAFAGLIPAIATMATEEEKLAAVSKLAEQGLRNKAESARHATEAGEAFNVAAKNLYETLGALLAPIRDVVYRGFVLVSDYIVSQLKPTMEDFENTIQSIRDSVNNAAAGIAEGFVTGCTIAETAVLRFEDVIQASFSSILLQIARLSNDTIFRMQEMAMQASWVVENIGAITAVVAMGKTTFAEAFQDMPRLSDDYGQRMRESLEASMNEAASRLGEDFATRLQGNLDALKDAFQLDFEINLKPGRGAAGVSQIRDTLRDLQAFESRVLTRGPSQGPLDKIAENTAKMVVEQQRTASAIEGLDVSPSTEINLQEVR